MANPRDQYFPREFPDDHDADIVLRVYELRREPVMREARDAVNAKFLPRSFDELMAVTKADHPLNAPFRQVSSYWEMVYAMARYGVVHGDFLMESNGEGLILYTRVQAYLPQYRQATSPRAFRNAEWVAEHTEQGRQISTLMRERFAKTLAAK